jgi:hypothetical protein
MAGQTGQRGNFDRAGVRERRSVVVRFGPRPSIMRALDNVGAGAFCWSKAACHQLKKEHRAGGRNRQIADFVDDQEGGMREHLEPRLQATGSLRLFERRDEIRSPG